MSQLVYVLSRNGRVVNTFSELPRALNAAASLLREEFAGQPSTCTAQGTAEWFDHIRWDVDDGQQSYVLVEAFFVL